MARLFPLLPFRTDETHRSWIARLAAFHIRDTPEVFLRELGFDPFSFVVGDADEVTRLCELAGEAPEAVVRNTQVPQGRECYRIGWHVMSKSVCPFEEIRFCPACLSEDDRDAEAAGQSNAVHRRERLIWRLRPIRVCPIHSLPLISRERADEDPGIGVFGSVIAETATELECLAATLPVREASPFQLHIADRIEGRYNWIWLYNLPLEYAITYTQRVGANAVFGCHVELVDLSADERETAAVAGWEYILRGKEGTRDAMKLIDEQSLARKKSRRSGVDRLISPRAEKLIRSSEP